MITLKNVKTLNGLIGELTIESSGSQVIDGKKKLLLLPALIDTDAPKEYAEGPNSQSFSNSLLKSGISAIFNPKGSAIQTIKQRTSIINGLRVYEVLSGITSDDFDGIGKVASKTVAIKTTVDLAQTKMESPHHSALDRLFQIAAQQNLVVIITLLQGRGAMEAQRKNALAAVEQTIRLAEKYSGQLCLQHLRATEEVSLVREAKRHGILVSGEVAYPHLFVNDSDVKNIKNDKPGAANEAVPFLPNEKDQKALWEAVNDGTIELIGSGGSLLSPELMLPLLLEAVTQGRMKFETFVAVTRQNTEAIFNLSAVKDVVLVDLEKELPIDAGLGTEKKQGPLALALAAGRKNKMLKGWPVCTIANGVVYE